MLRVILISLVPLLAGCSLLQRMTAPPSSAPEPDRSLWPEYCSEYRDMAIRIKVPASRKYPEIRGFFPQVPDTPPLENMAIGDILSADYDVDTGEGFPEFIVEMGIFALPPGTEKGQELAALQAEFLTQAPQDCRLICEELTSSGAAWLHVTYTDRAHGYLIKDIYMSPLRPDRHIYLVGRYGPKTLSPEWIASRRKVIEDIFRSVRIEKKGP